MNVDWMILIFSILENWASYISWREATAVCPSVYFHIKHISVYSWGKLKRLWGTWHLVKLGDDVVENVERLGAVLRREECGELGHTEM